MGLHYDNPNPLGNDSLRTQRMTADEAASVIALWQQERVEQTGLTDRPAVPDVAEGLDIPVEEVQRLLAAVRARRLEEERTLAQERELKRAETQLAEEEARLARIQQQRARVWQEEAGRRRQTSSRRQSARVEPVPWEDWKATYPPIQETEIKPDASEGMDQQAPPLLLLGAKFRVVLLYLIWSMAIAILAWGGWILGWWSSH